MALSKAGGRRRVQAGPYGPEKTERAVIATTDPETLPDATTWYLVTNLPAPGSTGTQHSTLPEASLEEIIRLYGLRMWIEQSRHSGPRGFRMGRLPSAKRSSHSAALAAGVLCLLLLLVPSQPLSSRSRLASRKLRMPDDPAGRTGSSARLGSQGKKLGWETESGGDRLRVEEV